MGKWFVYIERRNLMENERVAVGTPEPLENTELKRGIKGWQVTFIGLGGVIGSCYFLGVGAMMADMGPAVLIAFAVVGFVVYGVMIAYAELLVNLPRKGSFVSYTNEFTGETLSTGFGWAFWFNWVCYVPSEAIAAGIVINVFFPGNLMAYSIGALALLTIINLTAVDVFAKIESVLAIIKVITIILFIIVAFGIWVGLWGSDGFLGAQVNFGSDATFFGELFPHGIGVILIGMTTVLVTFQGTEIVGLAAAEAQDPDKSVPKACKSVTYRIVGLYLVPIFLMIMIFSTQDATLDGSVFAQVLEAYNLDFFAAILSGVVLIAAFSCANTGFYGTVRCLYGLAIEGLAPKFLGKLNKRQTPRNAVIFTLIPMWLVLMTGFIYEDLLYEILLSMSGFTGALAWIGILFSQIIFRNKLKKNGYEGDINNGLLKAHISKNQTWIPWFAAIVQIGALVAFAFGDLFLFTLAVSAFVIPMLVRIIARKTGHVRDVVALTGGEKTFEETFPKKN